MSKYSNLVDILDQLRFESPHQYRSYRPNKDDDEAINQARAKALIHLYLKVSFGLLDFTERERLITDKSYDGGIDAYYIDPDNKTVLFIQSKFRTSRKNFEKKNITFEELLKMDVGRVIDGEATDEDGNLYNSKIKQLQRELSDVPDIGRYKYKVIILANLPEIKKSQLQKLTGGFETEIFDNLRVYKELVFPVVTGTYYSSSELSISLNLSGKSSSSARISYNVETEYEECDITVVFVPTEEIGRILHTYQNSILKFNPRCYLEMKGNPVNEDIYNTIKERATNEFALFNNGLTMLSDDTSFNERIGQKDRAQIIISNPQLINGGQTSFTLSRIYEEVLEGTTSSSVFNGKEVLLKIITFGETASSDESKKRKLIEEISKATNKQSEVSDADRRSNDKVQIDLQEKLFEEYGYYYERKKGEFASGIREKYLKREQIIDREQFLRIAICCDIKPSVAQSGAKLLQKHFDEHMQHMLCRYDEYFYGYLVYQSVLQVARECEKDKNDKYGVSVYGHAIRYGRLSVIAVCTKKYYVNGNKSIENIEADLKRVLLNWREFEEYVIRKNGNQSYFKLYEDPESGASTQELNFQGYYRGKTLARDLTEYFSLST